MSTHEDLLLVIGRLEGKVDCILATMTTYGQEIEKLESRVRELEQSRSWALGVAAVVGATCSLGLNQIGDFL
jgi:hypothetical protein